MAKAGIFFGSSTGTCEDLATRIGDALDIDQADIHNVADASADDADAYDFLILGSSTWGDGELQDDWVDFLDNLKAHVQGKKVAIFGCGDIDSYDSTFCDAVGLIYEELQGLGIEFVGAYSPDDSYTYSETKAEVEGKLVGLCLDEMNHPEDSDSRIDTWVELVKQAM